MTTAKGGAGTVGRSAARLAAVQALYEIDLAGVSADAAMSGFLMHRWLAAASVESGLAPNDWVEPDTDLFAALVEGASAHRAEIDALIDGALVEGKTLARVEVLLRAILRAGTFELLALAEVPAKVAIDEYVEVAHAFYSGPEPGFVNGVLDRLGRGLRPSEMEAVAHGPAPKAG